MRGPGCLTHIVLYVVAAVGVYFAMTPESKGPFSEAEKRVFRIAAVLPAEQGKPPRVVATSLERASSGKAGAGVTFLLPAGPVDVQAGGDHHAVLVLERHPDWQLVQYEFQNTHSSVSRYRAYRDRVDPVSFRTTMHMGLGVAFVLLILPVALVAAVVNAIWRRAAARRQARS